MFSNQQHPLQAGGHLSAHTLFPVFIALCLSLLLGGPVKAQSAVELGVNLDYVNDWDRSLLFADAMKHARAWGRVSNPNDPAVSVDADGWPTQDAGVIILAPVPSAPPAPYLNGTY